MGPAHSCARNQLIRTVTRNGARSAAARRASARRSGSARRAAVRLAAAAAISVTGGTAVVVGPVPAASTGDRLPALLRSAAARAIRSAPGGPARGATAGGATARGGGAWGGAVRGGAAGGATASSGTARDATARAAVARDAVAAARSADEQQARDLLRQDPEALAKCTGPSCPGLLPAARDLAATQQAQSRDYYCGPATVAEMLAQLGRQVTQATAARELGTSPAGTSWADGASYPVPNVLNMNQRRNSYTAVALPWSPTTAQVGQFEADLIADINYNGGVPLAGNAYEVAGGPHLAGNPVDQTILHWFDIRGYQDSGSVTDYEDSVHGASSIGWSAAVPAYSSMSSSAIVAILGARGYDW
jgi:hypothetical protein